MLEGSAELGCRKPILARALIKSRLQQVFNSIDLHSYEAACCAATFRFQISKIASLIMLIVRQGSWTECDSQIVREQWQCNSHTRLF